MLEDQEQADVTNATKLKPGDCLAFVAPGMALGVKDGQIGLFCWPQEEDS